MGLPELLFDGYLRFVDSTAFLIRKLDDLGVTDVLTQIQELQEAKTITPEDAAVLRGYMGFLQ